MKIAWMLLTSSLLVAGLATAQSDDKSSKSPPVGPPWVKSFAEARKAALAQQKPIFVYSTKTY